MKMITNLAIALTAFMLLLLPAQAARVCKDGHLCTTKTSHTYRVKHKKHVQYAHKNKSRKHRVARRQRGEDATGYVTASAKRYGVPVDFALRIAKQESGVRCSRVGDSGRSFGPLQILNRTAKTMFGVSHAQLRSMGCAGQTDLGMKHLALAYRKSGGNRWMAALRHNGGIGATTRNRAAARYANAVVGGNKYARKKRKPRIAA